jgi:hypothetical protein
MKQGTFKKLLLIATFALFTITSVFAGYITKWGYEHPDICEMCGDHFPDEPEIDVWFDQVVFEIHTYICPSCGYWVVEYVYPIPEV